MLISRSRGTYLISYQKGIVIPPESTELSLPVTRNSQGSAQRCCETRRHCFKQRAELTCSCAGATRLMEIGKAVEVRVHLKLIDRFAFKQSSEKIILVQVVW